MRKGKSHLLGFLQVGLAGIPDGLSFQDMRDLWTQADIDGNGVVDYEEFKVKEFFTCGLSHFLFMHIKSNCCDQILYGKTLICSPFTL